MSNKYKDDQDWLDQEHQDRVDAAEEEAEAASCANDHGIGNACSRCAISEKAALSALVAALSALATAAALLRKD